MSSVAGLRALTFADSELLLMAHRCSKAAIWHAREALTWWSPCNLDQYIRDHHMRAARYRLYRTGGQASSWHSRSGSKLMPMSQMRLQQVEGLQSKLKAGSCYVCCHSYAEGVNDALGLSPSLTARQPGVDRSATRHAMRRLPCGEAKSKGPEDHIGDASSPNTPPTKKRRRSHKQEDPTNHGFWNPPCLGPLSQNVNSLCLCGLLGPQ